MLGILMGLGLFTPTIGQAQTQPPDLNCAYRQGSDVKLEWQLQPDTCGPYYIYASQSKNGPYTPIDTITNPNQHTYTHTNANPNCPSTVWYYYLTSDQSCNGAPVIPSDTIDQCDPEAPTLNFVSVTGKNEVTIDWQVSSSPETYAYILYWDKLGNNSFVELDTIFGRYNTNYVHDGAGPVQAPTPYRRTEQYTLASLDSCGNRGPLQENEHKTILMKDSLDRCKPAVHLSWTEYINWKDGVDKYVIFGQRNNGPFQKVGEVDGNTLSYEHTNLNDGDSMCYYIEARQKNGSNASISNIICRYIDVVDPPDYTYVDHVTVTPDTNLEIQWRVNPDADIQSFEIQRSRNGQDYTTEYNRQAPRDLSDPFTYTDQTVDAQYEKFYYRILTIDSCGNKHYSQNHGRNILLQGGLARNFVNGLNWNMYEQWAEGVRHYNIYRKNEDTWTQIDVVGSSTKTYEDDIKQLDDPDGIFCYRIEAVSEVDTFSGTVNKSMSNTVCISQYPSVYVPNAFAPNGENKVFKPVLLYADKSDYKMQIFNRWGQLVFETTDPNEGWDGRMNGKLMPQDAYTYLIRFTNPDGSSYRSQGTVVLIH
jgi:gliding motility-associated-like protein